MSFKVYHAENGFEMCNNSTEDKAATMTIILKEGTNELVYAETEPVKADLVFEGLMLARKFS